MNSTRITAKISNDIYKEVVLEVNMGGLIELGDIISNMLEGKSEAETKNCPTKVIIKIIE